MLKQLKAAFHRAGIDITHIPLTLDSAYVSQELRNRLHQVGFRKIIIAGKGNYVFTIDGQNGMRRHGKKSCCWKSPHGALMCRRIGLGDIVPHLDRLFIFFRKSSTRSFYLMNLSQIPLRGAEIWHIWKQHHVIECFWKIMKSIFHMRSMQLQGDGLYTALLIKVLAYLLALKLQAAGVFSTLTITEIMRKLRREEDVREFLATHFHAPFSIS